MQPNLNQNDNKNFLLAIVISLMILLGFQTFWYEPQEKLRQADLAAKAKIAQTATPKQANIDVPNLGNIVNRDIAIGQTQRIKINGDLVNGSISTFGARIDDISLKAYRETTKKDSKNVTLLNPQGSKDGYYAFFGWLDSSNASLNLPGPNTEWKVVKGDVLTSNSPVTLEFDNGQGLKFTREISMDKEYLFTYKDSVTNSTNAQINLKSYGAIRRFSEPEPSASGANYQGTIGIIDGKLARLKYREMAKGKTFESISKGGWLGFSDAYWLVSLIPNQNENINASYKAIETSPKQYMFESSYIGQNISINAGQTISNVENLYAGSKRVGELEAYGKSLKLPRFDDAIDWGKLWFLSKPFHWLLMFFTKYVGSIGLAMLAVTVVVKVVTFPLVFQSYRSFAKMKDLAPKMKELQEKYANDKAKQQQATIELYQKEKINPVAGCIPMILTMPIFFALFKVLSISLELRHAPFYGWIQDLSAKDPTSLFNLFGLIPYDPTAIPVIGVMLGIGVWPILYGVSMWLLQKMQPTATDPMQAQIFAMMPWMFAFIFAGFSSGLVIYYTWSNLLTIIQQYIIARSAGSTTPIDDFFKKLGEKKKA